MRGIVSIGVNINFYFSFYFGRERGVEWCRILYCVYVNLLIMFFIFIVIIIRCNFEL